MENKEKPSLELITILGPTASGKTKLAVNLAYSYDGEIISADSRQIYRGMDIGTGKDLDEYHFNGQNIPYHLINIIDPTENYSVYHFQKEFYLVKNNIKNNGKLPILCGGTGLYLDSILLDYKFENIDANQNLREKLESKSKEYLIKYLKNLNKEFFEKWNIDTKRRIIRGIELAIKNGKPEIYSKPNKNLNSCTIGIRYPRDVIKKRITSRLDYRLNNGMIEEVEMLIQNGLPKTRLDYFGLEYKFVRKYLDGELVKEELFELLNIAIHQFAKRQSSWFRRMEKRGVKIYWIDEGNVEKAINYVNKHMKL